MANFSASKLKVELKLAIHRLKLLQAKRTSLNIKARRELSSLLEAGKVESAQIRVEGIIREDYLVEALEIVELYCETLVARIGYLEQSRTNAVDDSIVEPIHSIIYASIRVDVRELNVIREMLGSRYGKEMVRMAGDNEESKVGEKLVRKLSIEQPPETLVMVYLKEIAKAYNVKWRPEGEESESEDDVSPPPPTEKEEKEKEEPLEVSKEVENMLPSLGDLQKRFEALKRL